MEIPSSKDTIVLCGFMASGKTSVGKALACRLSYRFEDTDEMLTAEAGKTISEIFAESGESGFRDLEHQIIQRAAGLSRCVISTGGGVMTFERNALLLSGRATIIHVHRSFDKCYEAICKRSDRPLAGSKTRDELLRLYETRLNAYERYAHYTLENDASIEEAVSRLCSVLLPRQL